MSELVMNSLQAMRREAHASIADEDLVSACLHHESHDPECTHCALVCELADLISAWLVGVSEHESTHDESNPENQCENT